MAVDSETHTLLVDECNRLQRANDALSAENTKLTEEIREFGDYSERYKEMAARLDDALAENRKMVDAIGRLADLASRKTEYQVCDELGFPWGQLVLDVVDSASTRRDIGQEVLDSLNELKASTQQMGEGAKDVGDSTGREPEKKEGCQGCIGFTEEHTCQEWDEFQKMKKERGL